MFLCMIETTFGERQGDRDAYVVHNHRNAGVNFTLRISDTVLYRVKLNCGGTKLYICHVAACRDYDRQYICRLPH